MLTVPRISTALATVVIETFFYGIYLVLFVTSVYLLLTVQSRGLRSARCIWLSPIVCGGSVLFVAVTGHWILTLDRLFLAFVVVNNGANPLEFYGDYSQATQIVQSTFLLVSLAIVDALFVHRLWAVWAHNKHVMIFPSCTLLGLLISIIGVTHDFSQFKPGDDVAVLANGWIIADCAFTVSTNIYCTALIAWKLWRVHNVARPSGGRTLMSVLVIIVESTALSAIWAVFFVCAYAARSNLRFLIDVTPAIVGAVNMLIYVRVGLGWAHMPATRPGAASQLHFAPAKSGVGADSTDSFVIGADGKKSVGLVW